MKKKLVLVYGFGEAQETVCSLIEGCHVTPRQVQPEELGETIGYLCGMEGFAPTQKEAGEAFRQAMLIFCNLSEKELDRVLTALREEKLGTSALKATVTPTNTNWTMQALLKELQEEHRIMGALMDLKRYRDSLPAPTVLNLRLMMAMLQVDQLLQGGSEVTIEQIFQARKNLQDAVENRN